VVTILHVTPGWGRWVGLSLVVTGTLAGFWTARPGQRAKAVELGSSLALLVSLLGMGVAALGGG
jgi:hypothetical protein